MKTGRMLGLALVVAFVSSFALCAWAADTPAAEPAKPAPKAKAQTEVKCVVTGKLEEKTVTNKKGKEVKVFELTVATAKAEDGKDMAKLAGKKVRVAGKKGLKLADFAGKEVTIDGKLINHKRLVVETIK